MPTIANTIGVGSGIDTKGLIDDLVAAERQPRLDALTTRTTRVEARISGMAQVRSALDALVNAMAARTKNGALGPLPMSSDTSLVTARATAGATRTLQPTSLEVRALATGQSLVSGAVTGAVGLGTLTLTLGTMTDDGAGGFNFAGDAAGIDIVVDATNNTPAGLAAAINKAQASVRASIIDDGTGARLVLKGPTGKASAFIVTATGEAGLDRFVHAPAGSAMTVSGIARSAEVVVDGVTVTRPTNTVADLLPGTTLELVKAAPGTVLTIGVSRDAAGIATAVNDLVDAVNALTSLTAALTQSSAEGTAGALAGDNSLRTLQRQLGQLTVKGLATLGVSTLRSGQLSVDATKLATAIARDPDGAEALLAGMTATSGTLAAARATLGTASSDQKLQREQRAVTSEKAAIETRSAALRAQLTKQYAAMEVAVGGFKSTQSFLDQQIKAWNRET